MDWVWLLSASCRILHDAITLDCESRAVSTYFDISQTSFDYDSSFDSVLR